MITKFVHALDTALDILESKGLFYNINRRKKKGISRPKHRSTIDPETYKAMSSWESSDIIMSIIAEALDQPVKINWELRTDDMWRGNFTIINPQLQKTYYYHIDITKLSNEPDLWDISFYMVGDNEQEDWATYKATGTGQSNTVFATVLYAIKQWIDNTNPDAFSMAAVEPKRRSLYKALLKRFLPSEWNFHQEGSEFYAAKNMDAKQLVADMNTTYDEFSSDEELDRYFDDIVNYR